MTSFFPYFEEQNVRLGVKSSQVQNTSPDNARLNTAGTVGGDLLEAVIALTCCTMKRSLRIEIKN